MDTVVNQHFPVTLGVARAALRELAGTPVRLARPVLVLDGWHGPWLLSQRLARRLTRATSGAAGDFLAVGYPWAFSVETAARHAIRRLRARGWLEREIDIVGLSMGGLVARAIAGGLPGVCGGCRVRAVRVFTVASPHRGAIFADRATIDPASGQMKAGSEFLSSLDAALARRTYELRCYAVLRDWLVGATRTAPEGMHPVWVDLPGWQRAIAHFAGPYDPRLLVEIARVLRGSDPLGAPSAPPMN